MLKKLIEKAPKNIKESFIYKSYKRNDMIIMPGESNDYLYILIAGEAMVHRMNLDGAIVSLKRFEPYSTFGEVEIFDENQATHGILALKDTQCILLHKTILFEWMQADFELTRTLFKELSQKLVISSDKNTSLSLLSVKDRLLNVLMLHELIGDLDKVTKEMLVIEVQTPRRSINRAILRCIDEGFITFDKTFKIVDFDRLDDHLSDLLA